jgi:hypothetical protein
MGGARPVRLLAVVVAAWLIRCAMSAVPGVVRFSVIAPLKASKNEESLGVIMPSVDLATQAIAQPNGPLPGWDMQIVSRNSNCSSTDGPLAAFELHKESGEYMRFIMARGSCAVRVRVEYAHWWCNALRVGIRPVMASRFFFLVIRLQYDS